MKFFGQKKILAELESLIPALKDGLNTTILLVGPSGYGKTTLAYHILGRLGWENCAVSVPPTFNFNPAIRFHFFDEVHRHLTPEVLYPLMADGSPYTFLFATNESGDLKEPLFNRCIYVFPLEPYTYGDLSAMCRFLFYQRGFEHIDEEFINFIVERSGGVPRILRNLTYRLAVIFKSGIPESVDQLRYISENILNVDDRGFDAQERMYYTCVENHGPIKLEMIAYITGLDQNVIRRFIEPTMVKRGLIKISNQGRQVI